MDSLGLEATLPVGSPFGGFAASAGDSLGLEVTQPAVHPSVEFAGGFPGFGGNATSGSPFGGFAAGAGGFPGGKFPTFA